MTFVTRAAALLLAGLLAGCQGGVSLAPPESVAAETIDPDAGIDDATGTEMP